MAQHDYVIANGTGAAVRSDLNNALAAIVSQNSGATEPATMYAYQWWADTTTGLLKLRNAANNAWITLRELDGTLTIEAGTVSAPGLAFASDLNTGVWSPGADQFAIATNGVERVEWGTSEVVFNDGGANYDFRIEGDTNANLFFVDASAEAVGIGTASPAALLDVYKGSGSSYVDSILLSNTLGNGANQGIAWGSVTNISGRIKGLDDGASGTHLIFENRTGGPSTTTTERGRWTSDGKFLVGTSSATAVTDGNVSAQLEVEGTTTATSAISIIRNSNDTNAGGLIIAKSRGTAAGSNTLVGDGDSLGFIQFQGADGTQKRIGAIIAATADAATGSNDLPTRLTFSTTADGASSPTERMRIGSNGRINHFSSSDGIVVGVSAAAGTTTTVFVGRRSATSTGDGTDVFYVYSNGNVQNTNGSYTTISDAKLKENIIDANSQWSDLKAIQIRNWNFKAETGHETHRQIGPIAQELETVCPGLVFETPDRDKDGNETGEVTKGVNQSVLYMKAVKALQEAMERIEQLETNNADLLARVTALETP